MTIRNMITTIIWPGCSWRTHARRITAHGHQSPM